MNQPDSNPHKPAIDKAEAERRAEILLKWLESKDPVDVTAPILPDELFRQIWPEKAAARDAGRLTDPEQEWRDASYASRLTELKKLVGALAENCQLSPEQQAELVKQPLGAEQGGNSTAQDAAAMYRLAAQIVELCPAVAERVDLALQRPPLVHLTRGR